MPQRALGIVLAALLLFGCASGYEKFYQASPTPITNLAPYAGPAQLTYVQDDPRTAVLRMYENGYALIGFSSFVGPAADPDDAVEQAEKVGAALVAISSKYRNTVSGSMPLTLPTTTTSHSSGTVTASGTGGSAFGTYSGTTTTYGTQTTYIPYSIDRYDQVALYFAPLQRRGAGVLTMDLSPQEHQQLGTNMGVRIAAVRKGSPAFLADILPGDIVLSIDDLGVYDNASGLAAIARAYGRDAEIKLVRKGQPLTKTVRVPAGDW